jgi:hypothetical protein
MGGWFAEADYSLFMLSTCYLALNDVDNARKYGELAAFAGMAERAEPLYFLAFYLRRHDQYKMAFYYVTLAAKISKPSITEALFISYDIYDYWLDYELATLYHHVFPSQHLEAMRAALTFWNNIYAPQDLRESFASLMKAYVQPIAAATSDEKYRYRIAGTEMPLAMLSDKGHVHLLYSQARERVGSSTGYEILGMDTQWKPPRDQCLVSHYMETLVCNRAMISTDWQFVGLKQVFETPRSGFHVCHGEWRKDKESQVQLRVRVTNDQGEKQAIPWSLVEKRGVIYCISKWHPAIDVGVLRISSSDAVCEAHASHSQVPRAFSFLSAMTHGVVYREDFWFLLRVNTLDAFAMVVLGPDFTLKAFTIPFVMGHELDGSEKSLGFYIVTQDDGQDHVVYVFTSESGDVIIKQVSMEEILAWMI